MRILLLNHYYWPDVSGNAQYGTQLAEDLARAGMEVHTIASVGDYLGESRTPLPREETHNGVVIHRVPVTNFGKRTPWQRLGDAASFNTMAFLRALRLSRPDVIITQTALLFIVTTAAVLAFLRRSRLLVWCQDVWPDIAFALGLFRQRSYSGRLFRLLAHGSMRRADRVAAIGRCMARYLTNGVRIPADRVVLHPNWGDSRDLAPVAHNDNSFRQGLGVGDRFVVLYSGNMGWGHPFENIMDAIRDLRENDGIHFVFIGGGQRRPFIEEYIHANALTNITLLPYQPYDLLAQTLSAGDLHLVSLDARLDGLIIPSKFYGALAVARPVLFLGSGNNEIAHVIEESGCGVRIDADDPQALVRIILDAAEHREEWAQKGRAGYSEFLAKYRRDIGTGRYVSVIEEMVKGRVKVEG
ncbi:MAG: glycosyltransferase family 4 protein [Ignavibacteria bacterium]|nr:glycosyltransferase family 4 protein [Ignavibacteria bacterium]